MLWKRLRRIGWTSLLNVNVLPTMPEPEATTLAWLSLGVGGFLCLP
jgi:hypothetical protein